MHLLAARPGSISGNTEPIDPEQTPADVIFLSAADSELSVLAAANKLSNGSADFLRLANLSWLAHPYSVDLYLEKTALKSKLIIIRALGGLSYWQYCLEQFSSRLADQGAAFAALPGDHRPDEELLRLSTIPAPHWELLHRYCSEGGVSNAVNLLRHCRHLIFDEAAAPPPVPLAKSGLYWPDRESPTLAQLKDEWTSGWPVAAVVFYRALVQSGDLEPINDLIGALRARRINPLPMFVASLKDPVSKTTVAGTFEEARPDIVLNATSFACGTPSGSNSERETTVLDASGRPVLQVVISSSDHESWISGSEGLSARDIAMNVALPEVDGRLLTRTLAFKSESYRDELTQCPVAGYAVETSRRDFIADLASGWLRLARTPAPQRRIAVMLANYPNKDGRIANGVGLDTPASAARVFDSLDEFGYDIGDAPRTGSEIMKELLAGPTNWLADRATREGGIQFGLDEYLLHYSTLPEEVRKKVERQWGTPDCDPFCASGDFALSLARHRNLVVGIQPARGYNLDPEETYHSPDLVPPHNYIAFYLWLRFKFDAHAIVQLGKHGNLEWLPGKSVALSNSCFPEAILGPTPMIYPFIVNDPGEGTQGKRRTQAVIVDHLTPPLARAETYGDLRELEVLIDEYYEAAGVDPRRIDRLRKKILEKLSATRLDKDVGLNPTDDADSRLRKLDAYLCEIKESQIRDGLHVFGEAPEGSLERDLVASLVRVPRGTSSKADASLTRALALDIGLAEGFDPLDCDMSEPWTAPKPEILDRVCADPWRTAGDTVERLEHLATAVIEGGTESPGDLTNAVLENVHANILPSVRSCGKSELSALMAALDGRFVPPGPSGAPSRGRLDVLPTGRNFFSVDSRTLPTRTAWELGWKSASMLVERFAQDHGDWPKAMAVTAWGTSNMRTGGDDIAQVLALMGVRPIWDDNSSRVTGFEIIPLSALGRPRVDVTLRISGFFRDAFPAQIELIAAAARSVMDLDENPDENPAAAAFKKEKETLGAKRAGYRVYGSKPGAYGAGLQALFDENIWRDREHLGATYIEWGSYAYGDDDSGAPAADAFSERLSGMDAVVQNQDNREHDLLDSDDYYQFEGGMSAAVESLKGAKPAIYHNDHSRPERPVIRSLEDEIGRVVRARAVNPKWIAGVKRHGYKGAFEIAATVDYMYAFAATTGAVKSHHFDLVYSAYIDDDQTREFIEENNAPALREMAARLLEALERDLWRPRLNSTRRTLEMLCGAARHDGDSLGDD